MNDSTLLLPDSGPEFIRTLNLAVLYSESVHVFTFTSPQAAIALDSLLRELESAALQLFKKESGLKKGRALSYTNPSPNDRAATFLKFTEQHAPLLTLAETEGVLHSVSQQAFSRYQGNKEAAPALVGHFGEVINSSIGRWAEKVPLTPGDMLGDSPPSLFFLLERMFQMVITWGLLLNVVPDDARQDLHHNQDLLLQMSFEVYILLASYYALSNGLATVTWDRRFQELLAIGSDCILKGVPSVNELLLQRRNVKNRLGQLILEEHVPNVADLPLEEVLEIRRKRNSEVLAFRDGLQQLAAGIDCSQDAKALELALHTKIQCVFKPALRDLRNATAELQMEAYKRLLDPTKEVGAALIPVVISLSASAPLDMTAGVGIAFTLLAKLYKFVDTLFEKRKVMNASPWSLLFRLQKRGSG